MIKNKVINKANGTYGTHGAYLLFIICCLLITAIPASAQTRIKIGGDVYGGGNQGEVKGTTKVTVYKGDLENVFGGARMANVGGNTFVHIDGEHATGDIMIANVYGGNDISGTIGTAEAVGEAMPSELTDVLTGVETKETHPKKNAIDVSWNAFVRTTRSTKGDGTENYPIIIGNLFGGGNGDFDYDNPEPGVYNIYERNHEDGDMPIATSNTDFNVPDLAKTYLEIKGGMIAHLYGGGNNATITENTTLSIRNESSTLDSLVNAYAQYYTDLDTEHTHDFNYYKAASLSALIAKVKLNTFQTNMSSFDYNFARIFGGNNKAEMHIRPTWNLWKGNARDLYSGGNQGDMTSPEGLLVEIPEASEMKIYNLYGGCRMADVKPTVNGEYTPCKNLPGYGFPNELSARLLVRGGHVTNVYGGNDITGEVYGGNAVGIYTTVYGDVYGSGNGAYAYTDNEDLKNNEVYSDFYYGDLTGYEHNYDALNAFRPNAEQVSIHLLGKSGGPANYTTIKGSVYLGGNCASLATKKNNPLVELKIGSYVIADNVFLGNNGEKMIDPSILSLYAGKVDNAGNIIETEDGIPYSNSLHLTSSSTLAGYMDGVAMTLKPDIVFDDDYEPFSSFVGSFYCGGNVGSMAIGGKETFTINKGLNIYEKFVGGCNRADVEEQEGLCAAYEGGVIGTQDERSSYKDASGNIKDRLEINLENLTITPLRWNDSGTGLVWNTQKWSDDTYFEMEEGTKLEKDDEYYTYTAESYTENTVTGEAHTVLESEDFYSKEGDVYTKITTGTELAVDSKYYTYTAAHYTKQTAASDKVVGASDHFFEKGGFVEVARDASDHDIRLVGGNVYGGCYESGHVNGNIAININEDVLNKENVFGTKADAIFGNPASGVELEDQRDDLMAVALSVFGAGYGEKTEVWGNTTVNHNNGYVFQIYGGGQSGVVGKKVNVTGEGGAITQEYVFDPAYSSTVNLNGAAPVYSSTGAAEDLAETEYIYGGGNEGDVCGNTLVNLGNGRIYDAFGGCSDADILGHSEVYIGRQPNGSSGYKQGFPWIRDIVYGGNDFGGTIWGEYEDDYDFEARLRNYETDKTQLHGYKDGEVPDVMKSSSYVEYIVGRVDTIFGGGYGCYDYTDTDLYGTGCSMPVQHSSFVNIRPNDHDHNYITSVFGGGTGYPRIRVGDRAQDRSYVLIDIPDNDTKFNKTEVFGAGSYNGVGMGVDKTKLANGTIDPDEASAIVDLLHGRIKNVFGGSFQEGVTRRTVVNVPAESTIQIDSIFGGAYGRYILPPCDVYESQVNYKNTSKNAQVFGAIFGGNNKSRRTLFAQVNISSPVYTNKAKGYTGNVYGAGRGVNTWTEYTEVNMLDGSDAYEVYGGGEMGHVLSAESVQKYMQTFKDAPSPDILAEDPAWASKYPGATETDKWHAAWKDAWTLGDYYTPDETWEDYANNASTNLSRISERPELDDKTASQLVGTTIKKFNSNVIVNDGGTVSGYAYGGGLGAAVPANSGDVWGRTYVAVLGGEVKKDVYGGGRAGGVSNQFHIEDFTASSNVYIQGGTARNVYGGGYEGHVGKHTKIVAGNEVNADISDAYTGDLLAYANVVIGKTGTNTFKGGAPAITRNVYGGGEGGSVYGTSKISLNNGYIGYRYKNSKYVEELDDKTTNDLDLSGNLFGGGYVINSYVDNTIINMYGGTVRGSLYGGGEVGPIGRGANMTSLGKGGIENGDATIFRAGTTQVNMYDGYVLRNVFGGGRGKDSWGGDGTMYMNEDVVTSLKANGLFCKGYVFGQTRVNIYGGEVGTDEGMQYGYGNVFGGCDEGTVYSAYMDGNTLCIGKKDGVRYNEGLSPGDPGYNYQGYYYKYKNGNYETINIYYTQAECDEYNTEHSLSEGAEGYRTTSTVKETERQFTEDCKVLVEPHTQAYVDITIPGGGTYKAGEYVPTSDLDKLKNKTADAAYWDNLDPDGIIIHNAVFAGGNIAAGSSSMFANSTTVHGNATASINDIYNRDLITIGTGHTGGLYGDGNLTFVDGYRELNITNYGTDYYHISQQLPYDEYKVLPAREQAYYELKYKCLQSCTDNAGTTYSVGSNLPYDELLVLFTNSDGTSVQDGTTDILVTEGGKKVPNSTYWEENGVVSVYAGRIMNTIQRADFCGVFGSRMVMKGAQDRVPEETDFTNYTINRVREVSLNKELSVADPDSIIVNEEKIENPNYKHGNYFGIYNVVNYLGALTSDVKFSETRKTNARLDQNPELEAKGESYYAWKATHIGDKKRNNGTCHNHLALASGVYLELTTEQSTGTDIKQKDWGPITGVIELDLINVQPGIGGGFVYAKNIHGVPSETNHVSTTLTTLNRGAATQWDYDYQTTEDDEHQKQWETSGNFIHSSQTIIDDCYNISNRYMGPGKVPAHYWYIAGSVYVYDQYISAYTGSPNAYSETVEVPITINAASHGTMTLLDVQPNLYAYYSAYTNESNNTPLTEGKKLVINDITYQLNTPISYWDWNKLPAAEKSLFVRDTYVTVDSCKIGNDTIPAGKVLLKEQYKSLSEANDSVFHIHQKKNVAFEAVFRSSNNMSHNTGYLLTYKVTNPSIWDAWYTPKSNTDGNKITFAAYNTLTSVNQAKYEDGPTYTPTTTGLYGQQKYEVNAIISQKDYYAYEGYNSNGDEDYTDVGDVYGLKQMYPAVSSRTDQATFVPAYLITKEYLTEDLHYYPGAPVSAAISGYTTPAYICTATIQLSPTEYVYVNELMTEEKKNNLKTKYSDLATEFDNLIVPAYYCTVEGKYGGSYYEEGKNYRALEAYSAMSPEDREQFTFNYDALDLLVDPAYGGTVGKKYQYDGKPYDYTVTEDDKETMIYSLTRPIDYTATYNSTTPLELTTGISVKRYNSTKEEYETLSGITILQKNDELLSTVYDALPNEQHHYAPIVVDKAGDYYIVKESFVHGEIPYAVGTTIDSETFDRLADSEKKNYIDTLTFAAGDVKLDGSSKPIPYYYCRESYEVNENGEGVSVTLKGETSATYISGDTVPVGTLIDATCYNTLPNKQKNFTIHGVSPMETSTLFVSRGADINDLSTEKVITVIYKYDYEESDVDGTHITPVSERHIVNIHINFKSGVPTVEDINPPTIVLPGTGITMRIPTVTPGAYEITGGGWELFEKPSDAESHINGVAYTPNSDPLYWYQDGFYLAYYAQTYLGKTYSNHVPVSVANYHDLKKVMDDKTKHLYVDYDRNRLHRESKIYINDYSGSSENGLKLFKDFYDLSVLEGYSTDGEGLIDGGTFDGHKPLNTHETNGVKAGQNLEFFLRTDISWPSGSPAWTPIASGTEDPCFEGNLHGDGHTLSGLGNTLFHKLCGNVYNLGVTGSFTTAGLVDTGKGYVENCWINTTGTPANYDADDDGVEDVIRAVFGKPSAGTDIKQIVNSYYQEGKAYSTTDTGNHGLATAKPDKAFYDGEVAYDLNGFYLYKRYNDGVGTASGVEYKYWKDGEADPQTAFYADNMSKTLCSSGYNGFKYVEDRFADGDFIYAAGEIPTSEDERHWVDTEDDNKGYYFPIWPDDYIFFGQKLTYGWAEQAHQVVPTAVARDGGRLSLDDDANRVYRAPAYYRSKAMGMVHFNPTVYLAQTQKDVPAKLAYPNMTAIDFKGHYYKPYEAYGTYGLGNATGKFYTPVLDDDGLVSIQNCDETQNLLVYAPSASTNAQTLGVLTSYFTEPEYADYYHNTGAYDGYRLVEEAPSASVHGHLVQNELTATNDHLLVDKQDFNAPIAYTFDEEHLMWYQRTPANSEFVDHNTGWQGISLPFTAELVTTNQKGEITHFYNSNEPSENSKNGTNTKIGHEYWLRELDTEVAWTESEKVLTATFDYPDAGISDKTVENTFLWDYYYEKSDRQDKNSDIYQEYYRNARTHKNYSFLTAAKPYILGLPGQTYYEFDLSGKFEAENTAAPIAKLGKQIITFVSDKTETIGVSDDEMKGDTVTYDGLDYIFKPSYMNENLAAGTNSYALDNDGNSFDQVPASGDATAVSAFRPFFVAETSGGGSVKEMMPRSIIFANANDDMFNEDPESALNGTLEIFVRGRKIYTRSHMKEPTTVRIVNVAGITLANFVIEPEQTIVTPVKAHGTYIVNLKKVFVK